MKKIILCFSILLISVCVYCQDLIVKKNTDEIQVKIIEVGLTEVKYKNWNNQDGPTYVINKSEIFMIKYANGDKESYADFNSSQNPNMNQNENSTKTLSTYTYYEYYPKAKSMLKINDEIATVEESKKILGEDTYRRMASNCLGEVFGYVFITLGTVTVCAGIGVCVYTEREPLYGGYYSSIFPLMKEGLICMAIGAVMTAVGLPLAIVLPKKNKAIVAKYSEQSITLSQTQQNIKLKMANNGIGLVLNF